MVMSPAELLLLDFRCVALLYNIISTRLFYIVRLLRPSLLYMKLLFNDGLAMTRLRQNEEKIKPTASRHCEACQIEWTSLLAVVASRSKLNFSTPPSCHVEPLTIFIYKFDEIKARHLRLVDL